MQARRRKVAGGTPPLTPDPAPDESCNLEDTGEPEVEVQPEPEGGDDRWAGDPEEEPSAPPPKTKPSSTKAKTVPSSKDRHPMPWGLVIRDVFHLDVHQMYKRLTDDLTLGDEATEYGSVLRAVDSSARNLFDAARLARRAKLEDEKFQAELGKELEVLRTAAQKALEQDKLHGLRSKAPTIADIKDRMLATWPDQVTSIDARKAEMHGALRAIEALEVSWRDRCQSLRTLAQQFKSAGT